MADIYLVNPTAFGVEPSCEHRDGHWKVRTQKAGDTPDSVTFDLSYGFECRVCGAPWMVGVVSPERIGVITDVELPTPENP